MQGHWPACHLRPLSQSGFAAACHGRKSGRQMQPQRWGRQLLKLIIIIFLILLPRPRGPSLILNSFFQNYKCSLKLNYPICLLVDLYQ
jgi:hypothetical protein